MCIFVVQPVTRDVTDEFDLHGPRLQAALFQRGEPPDPDASAEFAARVRELLSAEASSP